jgi:hypothetical protein
MDDFSLWDKQLSMVKENRMKIMNDFSLWEKKLGLKAWRI